MDSRSKEIRNSERESIHAEILVQTPAGQLRRNRRHLRFIPEDEKVGTVKGERVNTPSETPVQDERPAQEESSNRTVTRSGREIRLPKRYRE